MNIQKIYNVQNSIINSYAYNNKAAEYTVKRAELKDALTSDVVMFQGKMPKAQSKEITAAIARKHARWIRDEKLIDEAKTAPTKKSLAGDERTWGVEFAVSQKIHDMVLPPQQKIHEFINSIFGDLKVTEITPKNLLLDISDRAKSPVSIMEKSATRKWNSVKEILANMTDLNGAKFVMNYKTGKGDVEKVLTRFIPLIKTKQIVIREIELQRPEALAIKKIGKKEQEEYDYASSEFLDKLEDIQEQVLNGLETNPAKIKLIDRPLPKYTKGNYCALHLLIELAEKGSRPFELQLMGARMANGKSFDDKRFKFFDGKQLGKFYDKLVKYWERLNDKDNQAAKERFMTYCKDANLQLREDELQEHKKQKLISRPTGFFKSVREYNLPPEYDLNEQYKIMQECESAENARQKQEAKKENVIVEVKEALLSKKTFNKIMEKLRK